MFVFIKIHSVVISFIYSVLKKYLPKPQNFEYSNDKGMMQNNKRASALVTA